MQLVEKDVASYHYNLLVINNHYGVATGTAYAGARVRFYQWFHSWCWFEFKFFNLLIFDLGVV